MSSTFKLSRDILPKRYQVPAKYWYGRLRGDLESEMNILGMLVEKGRPSGRHRRQQRCVYLLLSGDGVQTLTPSNRTLIVRVCSNRGRQEKLP